MSDLWYSSDPLGVSKPKVKPKVMLVDDEPTNIRVLSEALKADHDLIVATSATEAMRILDQGERPHLMLVDIMMPEMDGLEMCRRVKLMPELRHIPVIFITALTSSEDELRGFEVGGVDYIHKPIRVPSVRARVRTHLSLKGMLDRMLKLNETLKSKLHQLDQLNWRLRQQQRQLGRAEASRDLFERVFMVTSEGIAVLDGEGNVTAVNSSFSRITGYSESDVVGRYYEVLDGLSGHQDRQSIFEHLDRNDHWCGEIYNRRKSGEVYPELRTISVIRDADGKALNYVTVFNDITNLKETEQRLEELTWRDPITGLANRALFLDQLGTVLKFCHRGNVATAVLVIDIDNFRFINETHGFDCGDLVIRTFAERLKRICYEDDSIARLSGDEFAIVLSPKRWDIDEAYRVALQLFERIQRDLDEPIAYGTGNTLKIAATAGIALYPTESSDSPSLALRHAETAHRSAKGTNRHLAFFEDSMSEEIRRHLAIQSELDQAITQDNILLYGQSQFGPEGALAGIEILARWDHPERGILGPGEFIPFAERSRKIVVLERHIISKALKCLVEMQDSHSRLLCSINLSARHLAEDDFADEVINLVAQSGYPPELVTFELTESVMVSDVDRVIEKMDAVRRFGCSFSMDDFGTGYSSLAQLRRLPISEIKIDRSFLLSCLEDDMSADIVEMIRRIGESMRLRVVAEGVETRAHVDFLHSKHPGVYMQGYFFDRPRPLSGFFERSDDMRPT